MGLSTPSGCFLLRGTNGILGSLPNNKKYVEAQVMKRFCCDSSVLNLQQPEKLVDKFSNVFNQLLHANDQRGTLSEMAAINLVNIASFSSRFNNPSTKTWTDSFHITNLKCLHFHFIRVTIFAKKHTSIFILMLILTMQLYHPLHSKQV